jgi:hypothetical protein
MHSYNHFSSFVVVDDLNLISVALAELEANSPWPVDRHRPLQLAAALELMQADTLEWA